MLSGSAVDFAQAETIKVLPASQSMSTRWSTWWRLLKAHPLVDNNTNYVNQRVGWLKLYGEKLFLPGTGLCAEWTHDPVSFGKFERFLVKAEISPALLSGKETQKFSSGRIVYDNGLFPFLKMGEVIFIYGIRTGNRYYSIIEICVQTEEIS